MNTRALIASQTGKPLPLRNSQSAEADVPFINAAAALKNLNADDLARVNAAILKQLDSPVALIPTLASHLLESGGKRLRPLLTLSSARLFGYEGDAHVLLAAAVELIHGATLLHDDVVDESKMRRGLKTANIIWGNKESVLVGDFIFSRSFSLMVQAGDLKVLEILSTASGVIAEGEVLQLATQKNLDATMEMYLSVVEAKTAALFAAAAEAGAAICGATACQQEAMKNFGLHLGIAFQLVDDALDYVGTENTLGKSVGDDFREGKMTLPVVLALKHADQDDKAFWKRTIADGDQQPADFEMACYLMNKCNVIEDTLAYATQYANKALDDLSYVPDNEQTRALATLAETSILRRA